MIFDFKFVGEILRTSIIGLAFVSKFEKMKLIL